MITGYNSYLFFYKLILIFKAQCIYKEYLRQAGFIFRFKLNQRFYKITCFFIFSKPDIYIKASLTSRDFISKTII